MASTRLRKSLSTSSDRDISRLLLQGRAPAKYSCKSTSFNSTFAFKPRRLSLSFRPSPWAFSDRPHLLHPPRPFFPPKPSSPNPPACAHRLARARDATPLHPTSIPTSISA